MSKILFVLNTFPGLGGVETVTANLIEALGADNDIYVMAFHKTQGFELPKNVKKAVYLKEGKTECNIALYNDYVIEYNKLTTTPPSSIVAGIMGKFPFLIFETGTNIISQTSHIFQ